MASVRSHVVTGSGPLSQHKIFLCEWFVKLVRPGSKLASNQVQCHVPMKMTKFDIRNYFERIYNVKVAKVNTRIQLGKETVRKPWNIRKKRPDIKVAYLTLAEDTFEFPELFNTQEDKSEK